MGQQKITVEAGYLYTNDLGAEREVHNVRADGEVIYSVPGILTLAPLYCSMAEFEEWLHATPEAA